jgi:outer membrane protein, multidrug efflux system
MTTLHTGLALLAVATLAACASPTGPAAAPPPAVASAWQGPLPAADRAADLRQWWAQFDDPLLLQLIDAAQAASPSISAAANRVAQARAARTAAGAALGPQAGATAALSRGSGDAGAGVASTGSAGLQASWELDLFGAGRAGRDAAQARLEGAQAAWHDARIVLASEVATSHVELRACEAQRELTRLDTASRTETTRLTELSARAGFRAPADAALARASAAQGRILLSQQQAQCDLLVKSLVALTALDETALRQRLAAASGRLPQAAPVALASLPAALLQQRPDLVAAARQVAAAAADQTERSARRWPQLSLSGAVGRVRVSSAAGTFGDSTWSLGPLALSLPLFDGGTRAADVDAARAAYDDAVLQLQARLRTAVREVEDALVQLQSTAARIDDTRAAAADFEASLTATDARYRGGLGSLFELEDARRNAVAARSGVVALQRDRLVAWISLYRALGGGWDASTPGLPPTP